MRKIAAGLFISLDGVVESPEKWTGPYFNDQVGQAVGELMAGNDASRATPAEDAARVHFVLVEDLTAAHDRVVSAGAVQMGEHVSPRPGPAGAPVSWRVYRDPAGHPFCLVVR